MTKKPLISFVMPVYNAEKYLVESLISVLNQTYRNIELIAVNDGSSDSSLEILESFAAHDDRIVIINQSNTGIVGALNNGIQHARGDYIARVDADDVCFLTRIEKQLPFIIDNPDVVLVCSGFEVIDENSEFIYREIIPRRDQDIRRAMLLYNPIGHGTVLLRKSTVVELGGYSDKCGPTEDFELWIRMAEVGSFVGVEDTLYRWRKNRAGITSTNNPAMQRYTKQHLNRLWTLFPVTRMSRSDIMSTGKYYLENSDRHGIDAKHVVYANISQVSVKLVRYGRISDGVRQLFALASTGRTGVRAVWYRTKAVVLGRTRIG